MYRITAINTESDTEEEDYTKVTKEAEVSNHHNLNNKFFFALICIKNSDEILNFPHISAIF